MSTPVTIAAMIAPHLVKEAADALIDLARAGVQLQEVLNQNAPLCDARSLAIARTHLQTALMFAMHAMVNDQTVAPEDLPF